MHADACAVCSSTVPRSPRLMSALPPMATTMGGVCEVMLIAFIPTEARVPVCQQLTVIPAQAGIQEVRLI
jgi:hypothetical protein